jgi:hypothetical protein
LADRVRARISHHRNSIKQKRSFRSTIRKSSSSRAIFKRRPSNPSRVKNMFVNVSISQWSTKKGAPSCIMSEFAAPSAAICDAQHQTWQVWVKGIQAYLFWIFLSTRILRGNS